MHVAWSEFDGRSNLVILKWILKFLSITSPLKMTYVGSVSVPGLSSLKTAVIVKQSLICRLSVSFKRRVIPLQAISESALWKSIFSEADLHAHIRLLKHVVKID